MLRTRRADKPSDDIELESASEACVCAYRVCFPFIPLSHVDLHRSGTLQQWWMADLSINGAPDSENLCQRLLS